MCLLFSSSTSVIFFFGVVIFVFRSLTQVKLKKIFPGFVKVDDSFYFLSRIEVRIYLCIFFSVLKTNKQINHRCCLTDADWKRLVAHFCTNIPQSCSLCIVAGASCYVCSLWMMQMIIMDTDLLQDRGGMPLHPLDSLLTVDIIFKHKGRKDRRAAVAKAIAVVREKGELRECLLDLQWKMNEQRSQAKLLLFLKIFSPLFDQPAAMAPFIFSFFLSFFFLRWIY